MSFLATLNINADLKDIRVLSASYEFTQPVDHTLRPKGCVQCGFIHLEVESDNKAGFAQWMLSDTMQHNGEIVFAKRDSNAALKTVSFKEAYCVYYKEVFSSLGEAPMTITLKIAAHEISVNSISIKNNWPQSANAAPSSAPASPASQEPIRTFNPFE